MSTNITLQALAKQARNRLKSGYWSELQLNKRKDVETAITQGENRTVVEQFYKNKIAKDLSQNKNDDNLFYNKAIDILKSDKEVINPLKLLIDSSYYGTLSEERKQAYLMELSKKFLLIKECYTKNSSRTY